MRRMMQKTGEDLSPEMWIMKLLLGPIDTSYDSKGEFRAAVGWYELVADGRRGSAKVVSPISAQHEESRGFTEAKSEGLKTEIEE